MRKFLIIIPLLAMIACSESNSESNSFEPITVSTMLVGKGDLYGNGAENIDEENLIIDNATEWNEIMTKLNTVNNTTASFNEIDIDFENYIVIAAFDRRYGNLGHSIDITSIIEYRENIVITVEKLLTGNDASAVSQPYHIVKIHATQKPIEFVTSY